MNEIVSIMISMYYLFNRYNHVRWQKQTFSEGFEGEAIHAEIY